MKINIVTLIGIYAMLPLACILLLWLYDEWKFWRTPFVPTKEVTITCDICLHRFYCDKDEVIIKCPQCKSLNTRKPV